MVLLIILIFVLLLLFSKIILKNELPYKILNIYLVWWGLVLVVSTTNPFGIYPVSEKIYFMLIISVFMFSIGFFSSNLLKKTKTHNKNKHEVIVEILEGFEKIAKSKLVFIFMILLIVLLFRYNWIYQQKVSILGAEDSRNMRFYVGEVFYSSIEIFFYTFFIDTISIFVSLYLSFSLAWNRFNKISWLSVVYVYLYSSFGAGRFYIIEIGFYVMFFYIIKKILLKTKENFESKDVKELIKSNRKVFMVLIPVFFILYSYSIYLSNFRRGRFGLTYENFKEGSTTFFEHIVIYCVGSFRALEYGIKIYSDNIGNTFGRLSFGGLDEIAGVFITSIGGNYEYANLIYGKRTAIEINIGFDQTYNALFTNVFGLYLDFGMLGVICMSFLWGFLFSKIIFYFQNKTNFYSTCFVVFTSVVIMLTVLKWKMQSPSAWIFIIGAVILSQNRKVGKY